MFETEKSRNEFLGALRTGRVNPQMLEKAAAEIGSFADCNAEDILWSLAHADPNLRQFGKAVFARCADEQKMSKLMELYRNERRAATADAYLAALTELDPQAIFGVTGKMVNSTDPETRRKALEMLVAQDNWAKQRTQVSALLEDPRPDISEAMLRQVAVKAPRAYVSQLRLLARHDKPEIRALCLQALVGMNQMANAELFLHRLPHESGEVKKVLFDAVVRFIKTEPGPMTEVIVKTLAATDQKAARSAMDFFVKLPDRRGAFRCFLKFSDSVSSMMRDQLYQIATTVADAFVDPVLDVAKNERDPALRLQAVNLAKALKHQKLAPIFLHELKNPDWLVRYTAMQVLSDMKSPQALPIIVEALGNPESSMAAIQSLDKYRDIRLAKPFFQKLPQGHESEQIEIMKALHHIGDARLLTHLFKFLDSDAPKGKARKFAAETIIAMCKETGTPVPPKVTQIHESLRDRGFDDLPDLGLKMSEDI